MKQEVKIQIEVSITLDAKHGTEAVEEIVRRGALRVFPNNARVFTLIRYAEEAQIYGDGPIAWSDITPKV